MLELHNITKSYTTGTFTQVALAGVSVAFRDNEFVAILGQSGSGKTTMLNVVGGLDHFDSGDLVIDGISTKNFKDRDWDRYRNNRIGFVFQSYNLIPHQSVLANVELALTLSGVGRSERRERALDALAKVGLGEHVHKKPSQLSGGQMQRVAIARALINDPEILLADEPTGALDSATSVQVMDLLREVASDRLVIMVTHNPELAHEYATRVVEFADGNVVGDSDPFDPALEETREAKPTRNTRMGPLTALMLSFNNLMTKKGRTIMTSFAGSIGIIGIAAILALANGVNSYIAKTEENALANYPLSIQKTGVSMESGLANAKPKGEEKANTVRAVEMYTRSMNSTSTNDLASLKKYFDANGGGINSYVKAIEYSYAAEPQIYALGTDKPVQIHPEQAFSQYSGGFSLSPASAMFSMDAFRQLPENTALYTSKYRVLDGRWPTNAHELVLVLDENGEMPDLYEYTLGLKDHAKLDEMMENTQAGRASGDSDGTSGDTNSTKPGEYTYDQIIGTEFSRVNAFETYTHNDDTGTWIDRSGDADFMREKIDKGERLTIVGIVRPNEGEDMGALQQGISYLPALTDQVITEAAQSEIVHEQRAHPDVDVFTGKTFDELKNDDQGDDFDMSSLFTVDQEKIRGAFQIDESKLQMDLSGLDLSSIPAPNFDPGALDMSDLDLSSLDPGAAAVGSPNVNVGDLDLADLTARYPQLADIDLPGVLAKALEGEVVRPGAGEYLSGEAGALVQGFQAYYAAHADSDGDQIPDRDTAEVVLDYLQTDEVRAKIEEISNSDQVVNRELLEQQLSDALGEDPALQEISSAVSSDLSNAIAEQLSTQLGGALASQIQNTIGEYMTTAIGSMMQEYMSALQGEIERQINDAMSTMGENIANAMSVDPEKFADAFEMNMDKEELAAFMSTMVSTRAASYEDNLEKLGWADRTSPDQVDIYPASFKDKDKVKAILDSYNAQAKARGEKKKEIVYTDMVGMLMSSVTSIINVITWMLIAFVSISLVVSSIMIAIITYISVLERRKEIGILRAVGASKADVRHVFNAETVIEGLLAGLMGVGVTLLLCIPANIIVEQKFDVENIASLPPLAGVILVGISVVLTVLAGVIPSGRAARQDPVEALRAE